MDSMTNTLGLTIAMAYTTITASFLAFTESDGFLLKIGPQDAFLKPSVLILF